jgi:DNA-binding NarL/FixJ family response regulator
MRILLVDNQFHTRQCLKAILDGWDRILETRKDVNLCEALNILEEFQPQAILMDVRMPKRSGIGAIRWIRENYQSIKIIVLSVDPDIKAKILAAGADVYVNKSDPPKKLREAFKNVLRDIEFDPRHLYRVQNSLHPFSGYGESG